MGKNTKNNPIDEYFEHARDELFSHILRCGVLEAAREHQREWFDDTMEYLAERYEMLGEDKLRKLRTLGERYVQPVIPHTANDELETVSS